MSVTISIQNNIEHCTRNNTVKYEDYECLSCGGLPGGCDACGGKGTEKYPVYPHELNLANGNFARLWQSIGLEPEPYGHMSADELIAALRNWNLSQHERKEEVIREPGRATIIMCGLTPDQAFRHVTTLLEIAIEAQRRGEIVYWG
jgi:hypothetical protein